MKRTLQGTLATALFAASLRNETLKSKSREGAFYVKGGLYQVAERLQTYIENHGAKAKLPQWGTYTMYLAVKEEDLPNNLSLFQQIFLSEQGDMTEGEHIFVSISHPNDEKRAPKGYRTITASTYIELNKWQTKEAYDAKKQ